MEAYIIGVMREEIIGVTLLLFGARVDTLNIVTMDHNLYIAASEGKVGVLSQLIDQLEIQTTANRNTALHVAAQFGQLQCVVKILELRPSLLGRENMRGETPLHMAAREGYADIVKALIEYCTKKVEEDLESGLSGEAKKMLRATNVDRDTAMHMAARNCHLKLGNYLAVVRLLTEQDPEFEHPPNNVGETPLYLAAERGNVDMVATILGTCTSPTYGGPGGKTALHAAALTDSKGLNTKRLLESKNDLINQADAYGWTALHYAACNGNERSVKELLAKDKLGVYIAATHKDGLDTALHIAAAQGHVHVINELLSRNPDCWEMVNSKGQNVLHIAVVMNMESVIEFILDQSWVRHLLNQKDNEGNTPLHLLIASDCKDDKLWKHPRADQHAVNAKDMTPIDLVWSNFKEASTSTFAATHVMDDTFLDLGICGGRTIACNAHNNLAKLERARTHEKEMRKMTRQREAEAREAKEQREAEAKEAKKRREAEATEREDKEAGEKDATLFQTLVIVASLIATITFAAAFAIPGGYNGNQGSDQGMAVLARRAAFKGFVISNTIAMVCSVTSIFLCFTSTFVAQAKNKKLAVHIRYCIASSLLVFSMLFLMLAYITAAFAVLAHSIALVVSACIIACITFIVYFFELKQIFSLVREEARN